MKRLICIVICVLIFLTFIFQGCSKDKKEEKNEKKSLKIAIMYDEKNQGEAYKELIKEFEKNNGTKIELLYSYNDEKKIEESVNKGDIDIIGINRGKLIEYAKSGLLFDITDFIDEKKLDKKLYKICIAYGEYNGKNYGIGDMPMNVEWFYNTSIFNKYNIKEPENLKQLIDISSRIKSNKITPIGIGAMDAWTAGVLFSAICSQTVDIKEFTSNYGSDIKSYEKIANIKDAFNIFSKVSNSCIAKESLDINYKKSIEEFVAGKSAILPMGSWAIEAIEQLKPAGFTYNVFEKPVIMTDQYISKYSASAGQVLVIPAKSKNIDEAKKFIEFLFSEGAQKYFTDKGYISSVKTANSSEDNIKSRILLHLEETDDNSIMIIDNMEPDIAQSTTNVLLDIIEKRVQPNEAWSRVLKTAFKNKK